MEELREAQIEFLKILSVGIELTKLNKEEVIKYLEQQREIIEKDILIDNETESVSNLKLIN